MRLLVGRTPSVKEDLQLRAVAGKGTPAILRYTRNQPLDWRVEPDSGAVGLDDRAVLRVDERAAAGRHHGVPDGHLIGQHRAFDPAKVRLTVLREDVRHRSPFALLDELVDVHEAP